jgi:hypothetical protein
MFPSLFAASHRARCPGTPYPLSDRAGPPCRPWQALSPGCHLDGCARLRNLYRADPDIWLNHDSKRDFVTRGDGMAKIH